MHFLSSPAPVESGTFDFAESRNRKFCVISSSLSTSSDGILLSLELGATLAHRSTLSLVRKTLDNPVNPLFVEGRAVWSRIRESREELQGAEGFPGTLLSSLLYSCCQVVSPELSSSDSGEEE